MCYGELTLYTLPNSSVEMAAEAGWWWR